MLWLFGLVVLVLALAAIWLPKRIADAVTTNRDYETIAYAPGWITLRDGRSVNVAPGARLRALKNPVPKGMAVILDGSARFRAGLPPTSNSATPPKPLLVRTRNADVLAARAEFGVSVRGDTTEIAVFPPSQRIVGGSMVLPSNVLVDDRVSSTPITVNETEVLRVVRGSKAVIIGRTPGDEKP